MAVHGVPMRVFNEVCKAAGLNPADVFRISADANDNLVQFFVHRRNADGNKYLVGKDTDNPQIAIDVVMRPFDWSDQ